MAKADPQMTAVMDELAELNPKPLPTLTAKQARQQPTPTDAVKPLMTQRAQADDAEPVAKVVNRQIPGGPAGARSPPASTRRRATGRSP